MTVTALLLLLKEAGKWLLNPKNWLYVLGVVALLFLLYSVSGFIYGRGVAHQAKVMQPTIDAALKAAKDSAESEAAYRGEYDNWMANSKKAKDQFIAEQGKLIDDLQRDLKTERERKLQAEVRIREVVKYIPAEVDGSVVLPLGAVRLYADALQGKAANDAALGPVSFGPEGNVGQPSGVTLSQFVSAASGNAAQCVQDRAVLRSWQIWYPKVKAAYDEAIKVQRETAPTGKAPLGTLAPASGLDEL